MYLVPPKLTYEDIYRSHERPSYEDLVYEHVQLRDEHLRALGGDGSGGGPSLSSHHRRGGAGGGPGRGEGRGSGGRGGGGGDSGVDIDEDQSWLEWILDGDEGWVAVVTIVTGILKVVLQVLG